MSTDEFQFGTNINGTLNKSAVIFKVVVKTKVLGYEADLRLSDLAFTVVMESQLQLGKAVEKLTRYFMEENGAFTIELGGNSEGRPLRK